jgi:hypothetical protein
MVKDRPKVGKLYSEGNNDCGDDWDDNMQDLENLLIEMWGMPKPSWNIKAEVNNFGWMNRDGQLEAEVKTASDMMIKILPNTSCSFKIHRLGRKGLAIENFHHDKPMGGEWYYITLQKD